MSSKVNEVIESPSKVGGIILAIIGIVLVIGVISYVIPKISSSSDEQVALAEKKKEDDVIKKFENNLNKTILEENSKFGFATQLIAGKPDSNQGKTSVPKHQVKLVTNYGDLKINLESNFAPKSVENFVRLVSRGYYNETKIHRIVKSKDFVVFQGGDKEKKDGTGGRSAFWVSETNKNEIPDETWKVKPEFNFNEKGEPSSLKNDPEFSNPSWYVNFSKITGEVEYPKGLILMANAGSDTGGSQFFVTLEKTTLPAQYTVFGEIPTEDFGTLDKIQKEVNPAFKEGETLDLLKERNDPRLIGDTLVDGIPDKEFKIISGVVLN
jgi:cyclophilin family peptidyl-prolyl cis-trans isomerase